MTLTVQPQKERVSNLFNIDPSDIILFYLISLPKAKGETLTN